MTYQFGPDEPIAEGTRRIAREEIDGAIEALSWDDRDAAVHDVRKRFKKLRALLRLAHDHSDKEVLRARVVAFRDAARTIAELRDSRVLLDAVEALAQETGADLPTLAATHEVLAARHGQLCIRHLDDEEALARLEPPLRAFRAEVDGWQLSARTFAEIAPRLARTHRKGRRAHRVAGGAPTLENLHQWRKRVKDLWYHATLLLGCRRRAGGPPRRTGRTPGAGP
ncbi:MAG: CHAD domain-containing protein [Deltaproteobacteria bacterium]|nr:CHAD domain-containing protein [Deltaproteobacteria bacterium]